MPSPVSCVLEDVVQEVYVGETAARALFQARKLILMHWILQTLPSLQMCDQMGITLGYEKLIYKHKERYKFESVVELVGRTRTGS